MTFGARSSRPWHRVLRARSGKRLESERSLIRRPLPPTAHPHLDCSEIDELLVARLSSSDVLQKSRNSNGGAGSSGIPGLKRHRKDAAINDNDGDDYVDANVDVSNDPCTSAGSALTTIEAARKSMQKALDCQAFILSLFTKDVAQLCQHLRLLEAPLTRDVVAMIAAADKDDDARLVRDFRSRLDSLTLAYEPLVMQMVVAAASNTSAFPSIALRDAAKAEMHANALYTWARTHVPMDTNTPTKTDKAAKLKLIPYIVAMAYAVRVKLNVHFIESSGVDEAERLEYLERSRTVVNEFIKIIEVAVLVTIHETSLVDMAMDYSVALTTYVTLMEAMKATAQAAFKPKDKLKANAQWDDGLSGIRAIFYNNNDDAKHTPGAIISLDNVEEVIKWTQFVGYDLKDIDLTDLGHTIHFHQLLFSLGADFDDKSTASIRLAPDCKRGFLDLPPADCLRSALQAKLATAVNVPLTHQAIASSARTRSAPPPTITRLPRTANGGPLKPYLELTILGDSTDTMGATAAGYNQSKRQEKINLFDSVQCLAFFSNNKRVASGAGSDYAIRIWDIQRGRLIKERASHGGWMYGAVVAPDDGIVVSASDHNTVRLQDRRGKRHSATLKGHSGKVRCVAWSADGQILASGSEDKTIKVWSLGSLTLLRTIDYGGHADVVTGLAFAGSVLVSCSGDRAIKAWKWQSGKPLGTLIEHTDGVNCVAVFPDYERLAVDGTNNTVCILNLRTGLCEHTLEGHTDVVKSVAVLRDGRTLVSRSDDGSVKAWSLY